MKFNRWTLLTAGVVLTIGGMLAANHLPWRKPQIAEKRVLASLPVTPDGFAGLGDYRKGMDAYISDNFPARSWFIAGINLARFKLGYSGTSQVVVGRDGWLYYDDGNHLMQLRHNMPLTDEQLRAWVTTFAARTESLRREGIAYYVVTPPVKERVFPEFTPNWATDADRADADDLKAKVDAVGLSNFVVLKQTLADARVRQPRVYSLYDTHWTGYGAYAGYVRIMDALRDAGLVREGPLPLSAFTLVDKPDPSRRDLASMLGISSFVTQDFPRFHDAKQDSALKVTYLTQQHDWTGDRLIDTGHVGSPVLQLVVDSFSNDLLPFLYPHFSRIIVSHNQNGFFRSDLTAAYHPNIVMVEVLESGVRHSMNPAMSPSASLGGKLAKLLGAHTGPIVQLTGEAIPSQDEVDNAAFSNCNLEAFAVTGDEQEGEGLSASGWVADIANEVTSNEVALLLRSTGGTYSAPARAGLERSDVASYFKKPGIANSGFEIDASIAGLKDGVYEVLLTQKARTGRLVCKTKATLDVEQGRMKVPSN